jgi:hypothetical protein
LVEDTMNTDLRVFENAARRLARSRGGRERRGCGRELSRWCVRVQTKDATGGEGIHGRDRSRMPKRLVVAMARRLPAQSAP